MAPRNSHTLRSQRYYDWAGERFWSVTTIIGGGCPKPALLPWGIKMVAEGAVEAVESGALVPMVGQDRDAAVQFLKGLPYAKRDRAANLGTDVHAAIEAVQLGKPMPPAPLPIRPHMEQFARFVADYQPEFEMAEETVYNRSESYAGTLDAVVRIGGRTLILDVKTGKDIYPETAMQLAAYRHAEFRGLPDGDERPMPPVDGACALHLTADGYRLLDVEAGEDVFRAFLYCREVFRWMEVTSKTVVRLPVPLPVPNEVTT